MMFRKILIANRGEIAVRIIYACRELGVPTVAVYSEVDRDSLHVKLADEAVCVGPARSYESYLNIPSIISAAEIANVDAIHPGYGYLAESAYFAEVCETCGIKFIGPSPDSIKLMGDKAQARRRMKEAGLPVVPGSNVLPEKEPRKARAEAERVGYPLIIKAVAGGGGRGMRIVRRAEELDSMLETARAEAGASFGSPEVYVEKFLVNPRHIEFQVLADEHGNVVHLGERECSIQRRHQKLIEETPSPVLTAKQREELGDAVCKAMKQIGYFSAGTVEFLRDSDGSLYFIEMNTRVQVEHPITEMVTGIDIVKTQILIAAGETLGFRQKDVHFSGHAVECRINAENPISFRPSPGLINAYVPPGGPGIRLDSVAYQGWKVPSHYDSLIAKLIAFGRDRGESLVRMSRALDLFIVEGIDTTIPLHQKIIRHPDFVQGRYGTHFLEEAGLI
jgi:acetyl-CoA carboxylase biotin carboxylase subunit